jgi:hypothetical protein
MNGDGIWIKLEDSRRRCHPQRRENIRGNAEGEAAPLGVFEVDW